MTTFRSLYGPGDVVYLRVAEDRRRGMVTEVKFEGNGSALYTVTWGDDIRDTFHYDFELSAEYTPEFATEPS